MEAKWWPKIPLWFVLVIASHFKISFTFQITHLLMIKILFFRMTQRWKKHMRKSSNLEKNTHIPKPFGCVYPSILSKKNLRSQRLVHVHLKHHPQRLIVTKSFEVFRWWRKIMRLSQLFGLEFLGREGNDTTWRLIWLKTFPNQKGVGWNYHHILKKVPYTRRWKFSKLRKQFPHPPKKWTFFSNLQLFWTPVFCPLKRQGFCDPKQEVRHDENVRGWNHTVMKIDDNK